ncbi:Methyl-accepting chemotaxis protein McpS [Saliniradius amylolyticus]|uniref:Methyl-accepting chemotaxis protein McpS n=1 Tax=Saliniradius amylolyticus TaxID=2183582 RepID=A0A2S2E1T3_9ALTE|nr:methyl-accepting chemotaxis protein [Saliniradius amylolyticus]AWL11598.1 Methyl-accepting chemotaxis protein McpS [Saliniradius amylolyticus]
MNNLSLNLQLKLSFLSLLLLLLIVAAVGFVGLKRVNNYFDDYQYQSSNTNLAGRIQANLLTVRMAVVKFFSDPNEENLTDYESRVTLLSELLQAAQQNNRNDQQSQIIRDIAAQFQRYKDGFDKVREYYAQRDDIVYQDLDPAGLAMRKSATEIITLARQSGDTELSYFSAHAQQSLLLGRLYTNKFLLNNDISDERRALGELDELEMALNQLDSLSLSAREDALKQDIREQRQRYLQALKEVTEVIVARNQVINGVLNTLGPQMAGEIEQLKLEIAKTQERLGQEAVSASDSANFWVLVVVALSLVAGVAAAIFMPQFIMRPIGGEPRTIERIARRVADGDLMVVNDSGKEVTGIYAALLQMVTKLRDVISQIDKSSDELSESASSLASVTTQTSKSTDNQLNQLSQAATAMEEMAASVQEVTKNAQGAAQAASETDKSASHGQQLVQSTADSIQVLVRNINHVSETIDNLNKEAESMGSILGTINGIAEQTNLLALNAAIEAARAGEQGRGFAVVADEVRTLASRTQQSTDEIQSMLNRLQGETRRSVESMRGTMTETETTIDKANQTQEAFVLITDSVNNINDMNHQIASAAEEQSAVAEDINRNIMEINTMAKETSDGAKSTAQSANRLEHMAESLKQSCGHFKL